MDSRTCGVYVIGFKMPLFVVVFMLPWYVAKAAIAAFVYPFATAMWVTGKITGNHEDSPNTVARRILGFSLDLPEPPPGESFGEKIDKWAEDAEIPNFGR